VKEYFSFIVLVSKTGERATEKSSGFKKQKNSVSHSTCDFKGILHADASNMRWKLRSCVNRCSHAAEVRRQRENIASIVVIVIIIIIIIIIIIYCNWVLTR